MVLFRVLLESFHSKHIEELLQQSIVFGDTFLAAEVDFSARVEGLQLNELIPTINTHLLVHEDDLEDEEYAVSNVTVVLVQH